MIRSDAAAADRLHGDPGAGGDLFRLEGVERVDDLSRRFGARLVLDARVQVFGVLADDHEIDSS